MIRISIQILKEFEGHLERSSPQPWQPAGSSAPSTPRSRSRYRFRDKFTFLPSPVVVIGRRSILDWRLGGSLVLVCRNFLSLCYEPWNRSMIRLRSMSRLRVLVLVYFLNLLCVQVQLSSPFEIIFRDTMGRVPSSLPFNVNVGVVHHSWCRLTGNLMTVSPKATTFCWFWISLLMQRLKDGCEQAPEWNSAVVGCRARGSADCKCS
jgi:hypothetical protein